MTSRMKKIAVLGGVAALLAIGAGVAVAGGALDNDRQAFLNDAAKRLNVTPQALESALQGAYDARIDAAVAAGKLTKEQGEALKKRSAEGGLPLLRGGPQRGGGFGAHGGPASLAATASYLGLTAAELRTQLESGKTLAEIAKAEGKSVDGLKQALTVEARKKLDAAVKNGHLTQAQAEAMLTRMAEHLDDVVNGTRGPRGHHGFRMSGQGMGGQGMGGQGMGGQPPGAVQPSAFVPVGTPA